VTGTVTLDGAPLTNADVAIEPFDREKGRGGDIVRTDANGKFVVESSPKKAGLKPGKYAVYISKWVRKDGTSPSAEDLEMEKAAGVLKLAVPPQYSNRAEAAIFTLEVKTGKNEPVKFELKSS